MKSRQIIKLFLIGVLGVLPVTSAWSEQPRPSRGEYSPRDGMRRPNGERNHSKRQLEHFVMGVGFLEKDGKAKLSSTQAGKIVNLISPWCNKSVMSEAQAKSLEQKLRVVLTSAQASELKKLRTTRRDENRRGGPNGERRGALGGEKRGSAPSAAQQKEFKARMEKMRAFMKTYNPFYPPTNYKTVQEMQPRMQERYKRRYSQTASLLSLLAKKSRK